MNAGENIEAGAEGTHEATETSSERKITTDEKRDDSGLPVGAVATVKEIGGPRGLEPTRYGDWEAKGRCFDF